MRDGDGIAGVVDLTGFFERGFERELQMTKDAFKVRVSSPVDFYTNYAREGSAVSWRLESNPTTLSDDAEIISHFR